MNARVALAIGGHIIDEQIFIADRQAFDHACDLIARFGEDASLEAANRAEHSRDVGNIIHFCHWRQIERVVLLLASDGAIGTIH